MLKHLLSNINWNDTRKFTEQIVTKVELQSPLYSAGSAPIGILLRSHLKQCFDIGGGVQDEIGIIGQGEMDNVLQDEQENNRNGDELRSIVEDKKEAEDQEQIIDGMEDELVNVEEEKEMSNMSQEDIEMNMNL